MFIFELDDINEDDEFDDEEEEFEFELELDSSVLVTLENEEESKYMINLGNCKWRKSRFNLFSIGIFFEMSSMNPSRTHTMHSG